MRLEGSTIQNVDFFTVLCGNLKIHDNKGTTTHKISIQ